MTRRYEPRPYAQLAMDLMIREPRCALWARPGMGKSVMTLTFLELLHNVHGERSPTLVLAPLRVARDTWSNEVDKWSHLHCALEVVPILGSDVERSRALRKPGQIYTTNYENLPWLKDQFKGRPWPFATVVCDESTKLKSFRLRQGGKRAQALAGVAHKDVTRWINLTGTPASNGLEDLWGQTWFLDCGQRLGRTFNAFRERFFHPVSNGAWTRWTPRPGAQEEIQERLSDICLTLDPADWFDLSQPVTNTIEVILPAKARTQYRELERELFTMIAGSEVEALNAAAKTQKCLQLANGAVYTDGTGAWAEAHTEKLDALEELGEATGDDPLLVAYHFQSDRARLLSRFSGAIDLATREGLAMAQSGRGKYWLAHPASVGHGIDGLQKHCATVVFFSQDWSLENHDQLIERVGPMRQMQAGLNRPVMVHYIVAKQTVDELVMARRTGKRSVQDLLMDYMKGER